jgi:hypothetical protein
MACDCIEKANAFLADHNTKMVEHLVIERKDGGINGLRSTIALTVQKIAPRGKRPTAMLATFCPLCGVAYVPEKTGADA